MYSKGNVVAMAITAIIITAAAVAFIVTFYGTPAPELPMSTALSETEISVKKAIALGISKWAETGFDKEESMWYNNGNYPPSLQEAKQDLRDTIKEEIKKVLDELHTQMGYTYEFDDPTNEVQLEFDSDAANSIDQLTKENKESITVKVSGFKVKDEKGNIVTVKEFETKGKFDYAVWDLYSKMYEWAKNDDGDISLNLQQLLDGTPYQLQICDCGVITKSAEDKIILRGSVTWDDRTDPDTGQTIQGVESYVVKQALEKLKELFADRPSVTCSYIVEDKAIENIPNIIKRGQAGCECASGEGLENSIALKGTAAAGWQTDEVGKPELYYGVNDSTGKIRDNVTPVRGFPSVDSFLKVERKTPIPAITDWNCSRFSAKPADETLCNRGEVCFQTDEVCKQSKTEYVTVTGDNEAIGMTKRIAGLVRFKCEDSRSRVGTEEEFKNLSAEVAVRFAVLKGAEPPEFCTTEAGPICLWGSKVTIVGLECTPWDDCDLQGSTVCDLCECFVGGTLIDPMADEVGKALNLRHEAGEKFDCTNPNDPACKWCHAKEGVFNCRPKDEYDGITKDCQDRIDETDPSKGGTKSAQCLLYSCVVEGTTFKKGCVFQTYPIPCSGDKGCRRCDPLGTGKCISAVGLNLAKEGDPCIPSPKPAGAVQRCYGCTVEGDCVVNEKKAGVAECSSSEGCKTYCAADGTCTFTRPEDLNIFCPVGKPDYTCKQCGLRNNQLYCGDICPQGCCTNINKDWGACIKPDGKCCPDLNKLADCPGPT